MFHLVLIPNVLNNLSYFLLLLLLSVFIILYMLKCVFNTLLTEITILNY